MSAERALNLDQTEEPRFYVVEEVQTWLEGQPVVYPIRDRLHLGISGRPFATRAEADAAADRLNQLRPHQDVTFTTRGDVMCRITARIAGEGLNEGYVYAQLAPVHRHECPAWRMGKRHGPCSCGATERWESFIDGDQATVDPWQAVAAARNPQAAMRRALLEELLNTARAAFREDADDAEVERSTEHIRDLVRRIDSI